MAQRITSFFLWVTILVGALTTLSLASDIGRPFAGYLEYYNSLAGRFSLGRATPPWWPGVDPAGPTGWGKGVIAQINGNPNHYGLDKRNLYQTAYSTGVGSVVLTLGLNGVERNVVAPIYVFSIHQFLDIWVPDFLIGICFWLLALAVFRAAPENTLHHLFVAVCLNIAAGRWLQQPTIFQFSSLHSHIFDFLGTAFVNPFIGVFITHFALRFPRPSRLLHPIILKTLYTVAILIAVAWGGSRLLLWSGGHSEVVLELDRFAFNTSNRLFGLSLLVIVLRVTWLAINGRHSRRDRHQGIWMLGGALISLPAPIFQLFNGIGIPRPDWLANSDWRYTMLALPVALGILILRYQSFKPVPPAFLVVVIVATSGLFASLMESMLRYLYPFLQETARLTVFLPLLTLFTTNALVWAFQGQWQGFFGRLLHWEQRSYAAVSKVARSITTEMAWDQRWINLPQDLTRTLHQELEVEHVGLWRYQRNEGDFQLVSLFPQTNAEPKVVALPMITKDVTYLRYQDVEKPLQQILAPFEVFVVLANNQEILGLLSVGKRWDDEVFDQRDLSILELLGHQLSVLLLAIEYVEAVSHIPARVATAQEHERRRIAHDLHDTIQQFLGRLPFFLEVCRNYILTNPTEADSILNRVVFDVQDAARTLRDIQNDLALAELEKGIELPLRNLVQRFEATTHISVNLTLPSKFDKECTSLPIRQSLYRVVQQALDNIEEHAEASAVTMDLHLEDRTLKLLIKDNGKGFESDTRQQARQNGHLGLLSMESRVSNLGGSFRVHSATGQGTTLVTTIPLTHIPMETIK